MDTIRLGMTGLEVTPIAFGTWQLGGEWGAFEIDGLMSGAVAVAGPSPEAMP